MDASTPASIRKTTLALSPLTVSSLDGPVMVWSPAASDSSSWPPVSVMVWGVLKTVGSKLMTFELPFESACSTAQRSVPVLPSSVVLVTVNVDSILRGSRPQDIGSNVQARFLSAARRRLHNRRRRPFAFPCPPEPGR